ncbi:MupG family TIM beta-alpha barrel fold protein [uncultured Streptococcus sp.]|uniref:DUF871 domain-containing protein n=2 Tax=Streptococcus TaxID=1301 RepID=UPI0025F0EA92|nr:MupG family TIM beta-alpha barrel fold protein [uncultured Streptococcus sp.]
MGDLGISIYPSKSSLDEMKDYVFLAARLGYRRIFTSMLEIADNPHKTVNQFREIIAYANQLGMRTSIDVNPRLFQILDISYQDLTFFKDLGVWSIRLDEGFTGLEEARMSMNSQGIVVELNISRGQHYIDMVMDFGADKHHLIGSHNFYPQAYTGLDFDYFLKTAKQYKQHNLLTTAFVDSVYGEIAPWPVSQLMVSAEIQRQMPITSQVQLLKMSGVIDDIIISSAFHSKDELEAISHIYHSPVPVLPVKWDDEASHQEKEVVLEPLHMYRGDYSGYMIRSSQTRVMYKEVDFPAHSVRPLQRGDITICNTSAGQYKGELQIVLKDRPNDGSFNVVGRIAEDSLALIDHLKPWQGFKLQ